MSIIYVFCNYLATLTKILTRPILFFYEVEGEDWSEASFSFLKIHSLVLGFGAACFIFLMWFLGIGYNMVKDLAPQHFILTLPVLILLALVFFTITFLISSALILVSLGFLAVILSLAPYLIMLIFRVKPNFGSIIKACFYSFAPFVTGFITLGHLVLIKYGFSDFAGLRAEENVLYYLTVLFFWGLFSIGIRRETKIARWQAVGAAMIPAIILGLVNVVVDWKILPVIGKLL